SVRAPDPSVWAVSCDLRARAIRACLTREIEPERVLQRVSRLTNGSLSALDVAFRGRVAYDRTSVRPEVDALEAGMAQPRWREGLNRSQATAVEHGGGPLLVVAGAGTGKTRTLASRVARLVEEGQDPDR